MPAQTEKAGYLVFGCLLIKLVNCFGSGAGKLR